MEESLFKLRWKVFLWAGGGAGCLESTTKVPLSKILRCRVHDTGLGEEAGSRVLEGFGTVANVMSGRRRRGSRLQQREERVWLTCGGMLHNYNTSMVNFKY